MVVVSLLPLRAPPCVGRGRRIVGFQKWRLALFWGSAAATSSSTSSSREQQAAAGSRQPQAAAGSSRHQQRQQQAAAKFQFYSRVSEVTLGPFLGFLCDVFGTKLGGALLFRMCFEKSVWLFVSCFGGCLIAAAPQQQLGAVLLWRSVRCGSLMLAAWSHQTTAAGDRKRDFF